MKDVTVKYFLSHFEANEYQVKNISSLFYLK